VSFGLFIIPIVIFLVLIFKNTRKILLSFKGFLYSFLGMIFAFSPRILFEVKHQFIQTKTLFNFFIKPKLHNPKPFIDVFNDRIIMFWSYFKSLFVNYNVWISAIILIGVMFIFFKFRKKLSNYPYLLMLILLASLLFLASLVYKDNFWSNYYEVIQYIFLFITLFAYYLISQRYKQISAIILLIYCFISLFIFSKELLNKEKLLRDFKAINQAVIYLYSQTKNKDFCLKIYTAPVIPYTYDYLTSYYSKIKNINRPVTDYLDNKCWFIIESDQYSFRVKEWIKENLPENGNKLTSHRINKDILIELWKK